MSDVRRGSSAADVGQPPEPLLAEWEELYRIRVRIEPLLLRLSTPGLSDELISQLEVLADSMERCADVEQFLALDREFHFASYSAATTSTLGGIVLRLWDRTSRCHRASMEVFLAEGGHGVHHEHRLLVDALHRRDADDAERLICSHVRRTLLDLRRHPEAFLSPSAGSDNT
jgi:DNA-binding GntR family transcriptional regulator